MSRENSTSSTPRIMECVPNFSEGRDRAKIAKIVDSIDSVSGVYVLHTDVGYDTNRTVVTFAGEPAAVAEAAFRGAKTAAEVIDMSRHQGTHPRMGATDVLPFVPVSGISLEECAAMARTLAARLAREAGIACYCYEAAALRPEFRNLAVCRAGEYEAIGKKMADAALRPDFVPEGATAGEPLPACVVRAGISVVGARDYLIAVNFNLDTADVATARAIAADVRQKGAPQRPYALPGTKAIGWFIPEYGVAQVSMNLTDTAQTPLHTAFETVSRCAIGHGVRVTGTEIIGLVPCRVLRDAGRHFLGLAEGAAPTADDVLFAAADSHMGLSTLRPFRPEEKVIELVYTKKDTENQKNNARH